MTNKGVFILGTDTGVGKTTVACALLTGLKIQGLSTIALKPIASGAQITAEGMRNDDALRLQKAASFYLPYKKINPFCFEEPIAPHIAAGLENKFLSVSTIIQSCQLALNAKVDYVILEGAGGVCVPLNKKELFIDLVQSMGFPIILVVGMRLGCLNQTLLTWKYLQQRRLSVVGWVANQIDPKMEYIDENINFLQSALTIPYLGFFPHSDAINLDEFSTLIDYNALFKSIRKQKGQLHDIKACEYR